MMYGIWIDIVEELLWFIVYLNEMCYVIEKGGCVGKCFDFMM